MRHLVALVALAVVGCGHVKPLPPDHEREAVIHFSGTTGVPSLVLTTPTAQVWMEPAPQHVTLDVRDGEWVERIQPVDSHRLTFFGPADPRKADSVEMMRLTTSAGLWDYSDAWAWASAKWRLRDDLRGRGVGLVLGQDVGTIVIEPMREGYWCCATEH